MATKFECPNCKKEQEWTGQDKCPNGCPFSNWFQVQMSLATGIYPRKPKEDFPKEEFK